MGFTDWRSNKALLDRTVRRLTDLGFNITNDEDKPLHATRKLKREPPNDFTVILAFPENYPLSDIRAHIQSVELKDKFIRCPIKHLSPPIMPFLINRFFEDGILEVCIRGAWNRRDFTDPMQVYEDVDEWVRDYILGGEFPYDFDFPENTFFFPVESKIQLFVDPFFLNQPYMQIGSQSFGTFELALCGRPEVGVLSRLVDLGGATVSIATPYDFPNAEGFFSNLTGEKSPDAKVTGLWQFCDVPPSPFAIAQKLLKLPLQLKEHLWKELHRDKNSSMFLGSNILFGLFFFLFGRPTCIFMVVPVGDQALDMEAAIKGPRYLKPHILSATEIFARHGKAVSVAKLGEAQISLLGAGALGSQVGLLLGRMGFQSFVVIDKEALAAGNVMRHSAFLSDVGCGKAEVVARQIGAINPYVKAIPHTEDVTNASFDFSTMGNSLVVSTIANDRAEQHVNQKLCEMGLTAVYGRTTTTSYACRVIRVRPGTDACLKCLECYAQFKDHRYVQLEDEKIW